MKRLLSIALAAVMLASVLSVSIVSASAAEDSKIKKNRVSLNYAESETEALPNGEDMASYIAEKKLKFEETVKQIAGEGGDLEDYSALFTDNTYAAVNKINFGGVSYEESDDAIVIGDLDNWENLYVVRGWIARIVSYVIDYKLITVDESAAQGGIIDRVEVTVTVPSAGTNSASSPPQIEIDTENCELYNAVWIENPNEYTTGEPYIEFEENKGYYMLVTIKADEGYTFEKTNKPYTGIDEGYDHFDGCIVNYGGLVFAGSQSFDDGDYLRLKISVVVPKTYNDMSCIHVLSTEGGFVDFWCDDYSGDYTQPYEVPEGAEVNLFASTASGSGYVFKGWYKGDVNASSYEEMFTDELITTENPYTFNSYGYPYICAKFEYTGVQRQGDQIQVWVTDGGKASVNYEPTWDDDAYIKPKDGNNYAEIGEVVPFWKGDEITVNAKPDEDYAFMGWYHVNIEWHPGENEKYEGEAISTDLSYTYKPGETVVAGDAEPLRYICAVFEKAPKPTALIGDANGDNTVDVLDAAFIQKASVGKVELTAEMEYSLDVNDDGAVDVLDALDIQKYSVNKITEFKKK